ncbi:FixH family protein [Psychrosphaera ytuae]|uniref:FixH family protein n=1 Tax=Psychrosphaera ytuae TaxID=2820710 RepID=A0A975DEN6_9GAMM|nr:FixH family protein [Psychrosphaera ytuae]QTH64255.1 FixH family protein [Psychrosphaera ytuae]
MNENAQPWYKHPWVWFVIALPVMSLVGGIAMITITSSNQPEIIVDDYYKKGKAINQELTLYKAFADSGIDLKVRLNNNRFEIQSSESLTALKISLIHSTQGKRDLEFTVTAASNGIYGKTLEDFAPGSWSLFIQPMDDSWKVKQKVALPSTEWIEIKA